MNWSSFPFEIRSLILGQLLDTSDCSHLGDHGRAVAWKRELSQYMLVCKQWAETVIHLVATQVPVELVINVFNETIAVRAVKFQTRNHTDRVWLDAAIKRGFVSCVQLLLDAGTDIEDTETNEDGRTAIQVAIDVWKWDIAELLYERGADLEVEEPYYCLETSFVLLCAAASAGKLQLATKLLDAGVPTQKEREDPYPLCYALDGNNVDVAELLLDRGASFLNDDMPPRLPLIDAAASCSVETISMLIDRGADIHASTEHGNSPLDGAMPRNEPVARFLIGLGAEISGKTIRSAVKGSSMPFLEYLIDETGDWGRLRAFNHAIEEGNEDLVKYFLAQGMKPEYLDLDQLSLGNVALVKILLDAGADPNTPSDLSGNSLYRAAKIGSIELVELLLDKGVPVNFRTGRCQRAIQIAAYCGHEEIVKILLARGADAITHVGGDYGSALGAAIAGGHKNIEAILRDLGATPVINPPVYGSS